MRKLNLKDYMVKVRAPDQMNPGQVIEGEVPYRVKDSVINLLFTPTLQLSSADLVRQNMLAMKLETCKDGEILLEEEEWKRITAALETHKGFGRNDVELVTRINEAEVVEVTTK